MKTHPLTKLLFILTTSVALAGVASAQSVTKANNTTPLNDGASWLSGVAPGETDVALWDINATGANVAPLGGSATWRGIETSTGSGAVTIGATPSASLTLGTGGITLSGSRALTIAADLVVGANQVWSQNANALTVSGVLSGSGNITKQGAGVLTLANNNTYTGQIAVDRGSIAFNDFSAFGTGSSAIILGSATHTGTLSKDGGNQSTTTRDIHLAGNGNLSLTPVVSVGVGTISGSVAGEKTFTVTTTSPSAGVRSLSGTISDGVAGSVVSVVKAGTRDLSLSGHLNISGSIEVAGGNVVIARSMALGDDDHSGLDGISKLILSGGTVHLSTGTQLDFTKEIEVKSTTAIQGNSYDLSGGITHTGSGNVSLTFGQTAGSNNGTNNLISGDITSTGTGNLSLIFSQGTSGIAGLDGTSYTFSGANTFSGNVTISRGSVNILRFGNLGTGSSDIILGSGTLYWGGVNVEADSATSTNRGFSLNGVGGRISSTGSAPITIAGDISANGTLATTLLLDGENTGLNTISGVISNNDATPANTIAVTKDGVGTWVLSGTNTYSGATRVNAGRLLIDGDQSGALGAVSVATAGTLGGSGIIGGDTVVSGTLSPGNSPGALTFSQKLTLNNGATYLFEGGDGVNVLGELSLNATWTLALSGPELVEGGSLVLFSFGTLAADPFLTPIFDTTGLGFDPAPGALSLSLSGNNVVLHGVSVAPIPEPSTFALLIGVAGASLLYRRRRK